MSITLPLTAEVSWAKVEDGFYVGSRGGEFLGYIDQDDSGLYVASDMYSHPIGEYQSLSQAMRAVDEEHHVREVQNERN
ncbi:hypothetical protein [Leucobacter musarum]|uniref:hypothetical protein n=1 Tax=Leucobacter musarum TaxID=1930747 RepID=UPI0006A758F9|nr:hypothetical protein [Leucobacter musarum]